MRLNLERSLWCLPLVLLLSCESELEKNSPLISDTAAADSDVINQPAVEDEAEPVVILPEESGQLKIFFQPTIFGSSGGTHDQCPSDPKKNEARHLRL